MQHIARWLVLLTVIIIPFQAKAEYIHTVTNFSERAVNDAELLVVLVPTGENDVRLPGWSRDTIRHINRAAAAADFSATNVGSRVDILAPAGLSANRLLLIAVGDVGELTRVLAENMGADLAAFVEGTSAARIAVDTRLIGNSENSAMISAHIAHGNDLRNYRFDRFKSAPSPRPAQHYTYVIANAQLAELHYNNKRALAEGVFLARELTNLPGSVGYPEAFANIAAEQLKPLGVEITILNPEQVKALGMGSLYGVSQGSQHGAHLLVMHWRGSDEQPIALVGKGNTFDTGGYNLKTDAASILRMQTDKAGGAAVVGAVKALAGQQAPINVVGVVPLSHNMISDRAQLPGDVVTAGDGTTIEIGNTDAEGRLILADGIWYAKEHFNPRVIADIATLTGAKVRALGTDYAAIFSEHDDIIHTLRLAGEATNEYVWQMPLGPYTGIVRSRIADMINTGSPGAQAGAIFLQHFAGDTPWVHIDNAGNALVNSASGIHPEGATGHGVRLLAEWVKLYSAQ